jgi:hypothetical protein
MVHQAQERGVETGTMQYNMTTEEWVQATVKSRKFRFFGNLKWGRHVSDVEMVCAASVLAKNSVYSPSIQRHPGMSDNNLCLNGMGR